VNQTIAFFDFDGTITTKDSLLEFIKYSKGKAPFYFGFALHAPFLAAYKLKIMSNQRAKEMMLRYFFGNMLVEKFTRYCEGFSKEVLPSLIRPKALKEIQKLKEAGAEVVIVSASPESWLRYWCADNDLKCIGTRLVTSAEKITGKIEGINCYGQEKVARIKQNYDLSKYASIYCYGDTSGDKPMLALGTINFYKPFR
jgi:phosphatidylglycerophosphatase C